MSQIPAKFLEVIDQLSHQLNNNIYAIRGTASLVLQGIDMNVSDIDIVCDEATALKCNDLFKMYMQDEVSFKESDKFKSFFGKFLINEVPIEIMGNWQIKDTKGLWSRIYDGTRDKFLFENDRLNVFLTTIEVELEMYTKMGRWNALHKLQKEVTKLAPKQQLSLF